MVKPGKKIFTQFCLVSTQFYPILLSLPLSGTQYYRIPISRR